LLIVIIGVFLIAFILTNLWLPIYPGLDEYKILRDVLTLVLSISALGVAAVGLVIYQLTTQAFTHRLDKRLKELDDLLDKKVQETDRKIRQTMSKSHAEIEQKVEEQLNRMLCDFYVNLGHIYWTFYEPEGFVIDQKLKGSRCRYLAAAIDQSKEALKYISRLDLEKYETRICTVRNNHAYHLAMQGWSDDAKEAIELAQYAYKRIGKYDYRVTSWWAETYAFVLARLGAKSQKREALTIITGYCLRSAAKRLKFEPGSSYLTTSSSTSIVFPSAVKTILATEADPNTSVILISAILSFLTRIISPVSGSFISFIFR